MRIIIPMAGKGTHLQPHTFSTLKSLLHIVGKPVVYRTIENLIKITDAPIDEIGFIIKEKNREVEEVLRAIAESFGILVSIFYQNIPRGTADAILQAETLLKGEVMIAFTDRLFETENNFNRIEEGVIWVTKVEKPEKYDVAKINESQIITELVHKPKEPISEYALIGVYYFKEASKLKQALQYVIQDGRSINGEYQLFSALQIMREEMQVSFVPSYAKQWFDLSNTRGILNTNQIYLEQLENSELISNKAEISKSVIIKPSYIGENVKIENSVIGPYSCIEPGAVITNSVIQDSIIGEKTTVNRANLINSLVGNAVKLNGNPSVLDIGAYNTINL